MKYVRSADLRQRWKEMENMMETKQEKKMDVVLPQNEKAMAVEVMDFIHELTQGEQREFMNFLHGAKFVMTLNRGPAGKVV